MAERVVITGMGIVCPLGHDVENLWIDILAGKSGMAKTTIFDASTFPTAFDAEVKNYDLAKYTKHPELHKHSNRGSGFAIGAAAQACRQAGIDIETDEPTDGIERSRLGIYLGAGEGSVDNDVFFAAVVEGWDSEKNEMDWGRWA
ncbi:MAG TPA: beta-ketoacyl synthase N-terminal-like domain-containing protein, partial [Sedimentisphaerales bacterium]|nr:beta-ketoacyl synthase N-terminal-like domain-containing protein [Sedimentisphaerales bacterium]